MPKGIRDHSHTSPVSMEAKNLKIGGADPNNPALIIRRKEDELPPEKPVWDEDELLPEEQRQIFIQVAALNAMNAHDTFEFMRHFIFPGITMDQVDGLIEKYRGDVIKARDVISLFVDRKFPHFNPFKQADAINKGLSVCYKSLAHYAIIVDRAPKAGKRRWKDDPDAAQKWEWDIQARFVGQAARGNSLVSQTYSRWHVMMIEWGRMVNALVDGKLPNAGPSEAGKLDARKISAVAKGIGVDSFLADRLAQLLCYGEQKLEADEGDGVGKYFQDKPSGTIRPQGESAENGDGNERSEQ